MKNKFISFLLAAVMSVSVAMPVQAAGFSDVSAKNWAYPAIEKLAAQGVVSGVGDGKFDPDGYITTAQFISMLMRMFFGEEMAMDTAEYELWYGKVLQWAMDNGLLYKMEISDVNKRAVGANKWNQDIANGPIFREEMAVLLYNFLKQTVELPSEETLRTVTVTKIPDLGNHNATVLEQYAIASVYELGCLSGKDEKGTFDGNALMTRAQACVVLSRVQELVKKADKTSVGADWVQAVESGKVKDVLKQPTAGHTSLLRYKEGILATGVQAGEKNVLSRLNELRRTYPDGMHCDDDYFYIDPVTGRNTGNSGCYALAMQIFDHVFGYGSLQSAKGKALNSNSFDSVKPGDHIRIGDLPHSVIVLENNGDHLVVVEGNFNDSVAWDNVFTKAELLDYNNVTVYSCY